MKKFIIAVLAIMCTVFALGTFKKWTEEPKTAKPATEQTQEQEQQQGSFFQVGKTYKMIDPFENTAAGNPSGTTNWEYGVILYYVESDPLDVDCPNGWVYLVTKQNSYGWNPGTILYCNRNMDHDIYFDENQPGYSVVPDAFMVFNEEEDHAFPGFWTNAVKKSATGYGAEWNARFAELFEVVEE